jgi:phosphoribosylformylglycinamidine synthase II/phosphoribosylformylglycinamidine synthase I
MTQQQEPAKASDETAHTYRVEVWQRLPPNASHIHTHPSRYVNTAHQIGLTNVADCTEIHLYFLCGTLSQSEAERLSDALLADRVTEQFSVTRIDAATAQDEPNRVCSIEVTLLPGVTDPAAEDLLNAAPLLNVHGLARVATGQRYTFSGSLSDATLHRLATEVLSNAVIQRYAINRPIEPPFFAFQQTDDTVETIALRDADAQGLLAVSAQRRLALDLAEMQAIQAYYQREQRDPSDVELEMLAQTWSEHCVHKTFRATVNFTLNSPTGTSAPPAQPQVIDGLLRTYIRAATEKINKPWVHSAFVDNAGIIAFDDQYDLAFKVETHNHPSALEPFGGANTGVGGVIRDVIGVSARPIANTDILCFGPQDMPHDQVPAGVLHPRRIEEGVVHGVEDYGNKMGIPTVNGAILYHPGYTANPLVFCGCLGILPRGSNPSEPQPGDLVIVIGGRTGRDGLRGATFSSMEMDVDTGDKAGSAVQIGHPIHEKQAMEAVLRARDEKLYHAVTDCGAGGLSSAVGELGRTLGVNVQLDTVPLKYPGLRPWEIWLSEAQERMVLAVPPGNWPRVKEICDGQSIEAVCIGTFESSGRLHLYYARHLVADLEMDFLHNGIPRRHLEATYQAPAYPNLVASAAQYPSDVRATLLRLLAHPDIRSKEPVIRLYDHEVQGATTVKPLTGAANHGPSDAAVLAPLGDQHFSLPGATPKGVALSAGICPSYTEGDPYAMAWAAIDEALRNAVAVGADPDQVAILDNFCWGNPLLPDRMGSLVRCAQGCYDAAIAFGTPFISGKDSLNNEYTAADGHKHAIPGTLLISAIGIVPDISRTVSMDLKGAGNWLYLVGDTHEELGGSHYALVESSFAAGQSPVPQPVPGALQRLRALYGATQAGLVQSCHDCSEGGLGVAIAEMCLAGLLGADIVLAQIPGANDIATDPALLFSESLARFIVEVKPDDAAAFEAHMAGQPCARVGQVNRAQELHLSLRNSVTPLNISVADLEVAWRGTSSGGHNSASNPLPLTPLAPAAPALALNRRPHVLILHATGTNRDRDAALACEMAGGEPEIVHVNQLIAHERNLLDYAMLVVPGGFSYGDDLGAGTLWALDLRHRLGDSVARFVADGRPVLGICNGFQALVKSGLLPGDVDGLADSHLVTLAPNARGRFECRWVYLRPEPNNRCIFTAEMEELIYCPVAHGEGRIAARDAVALSTLQAKGYIALSYVEDDHATMHYPANPNGSSLGIAGLTNSQGNVLGLMPHPENHIFGWQHPRHGRGEQGMTGLKLFQNGIRHCLKG